MEKRNNSSNKQNSAAEALFEESFMSVSLEKQIRHCDHYEIVDYFKKWLPDHQPILEAGCGSGRWVAWFAKNGWKSTGLDWSTDLCERARQTFPGLRFEVGDMRSMPFENCEYGSIVSLGSIEHTAEGPERSLKEYHRVLKPEGIAIISVPYLGPIRKLMRFISLPKMMLKESNQIRTLLGKRIGSRSIREAKKETRIGYSADFIMTAEGWEFYQYQFTKQQMRAFLKEGKFDILEEFVEFGDEGILHNFGRISGKYSKELGMVQFSTIGKFLRRWLPLDATGHMLCYIVKRD